MTAADFLARLAHVKQVGRNRWTAQCPAHKDTSRDSLSIRATEDRLLLKDFAGCAVDIVTKAVGCTTADLFFGQNGRGAAPAGRRVVATYPYTDAEGTVRYETVRYEPKDFRQRRPDGAGGWIWNLQGVTRVLYRLPDLVEAERAFWVEGEKDVDQLASLGLVATTTCGGAAAFGKGDYGAQLASLLVGRREVILLRDNDPAGLAYREQRAAACAAVGLAVKCVELPGLLPKGDVSDWLAQGGTVTALGALVDAAPVWTPEPARGAATSTPTAAAPDAPYGFTPAFPADHFVTEFIGYAAECVDAAHEHLETVGLILLATATPGVRARLRQYPRGLPTAFYAILIGDSTRSRKSSVAGLGLDVLSDAVPEYQLAEQASPEAFIEQLAQRGTDGSLWYVDEIGETLDALTHRKHLTGLRGLLLELYEGRSYRYKRTTKRTKAGTPIIDELTVERPHLSVLGCTTPAIFEIITGRDVRSGFLARFAVSMPTRTPPRRGLEEPTEDLVTRRAHLVRRLSAIYLWARTADRRVQFLGESLALIDRFALAIETSDALANERSRAMLQRLNAMTVKLAMLAAAGRPGAMEQDTLGVTPDDARAAVQAATRWRDSAIAFGERVGETALEQLIERSLRVVQAKRRCPRREVARLVHCPKKTLDDIEATLLDRGAIEVETVEGKSGPAARIWRVPS